MLPNYLLVAQTDSTSELPVRRTITKEELKKRFEYPFFIGVFGGATLINSEMSIPIIPLSDDCGEYVKGTGQDIYLGIELGGSLFVEWLSNDFRFWYEGRPVTLQTQTVGPDVFSSNGEYVSFIRDHEYNAYLSYFALDIGLRVRPLQALDQYFDWDLHKNIPFYLRVSYSASDPMFNATFDNIQYVNSPGNVTFPNGRIDQVVDEGEIEGGRTTSALNFEIGASWRVTDDISIAPQFSYRYELEAPYAQYDWNYQILRAGIAIQIHQNSEFFDRNRQKELEELPEIDRPVQPEPIITKNIEPEKEQKINTQTKDKVTKSTKDILKFDVTPLEITQTIVTQTYPVLPYIFFENNSSEIPLRYKSNPETFSEAMLPKETIGIYYNLLDIIGNRLENSPATKITLVGTSDGKESNTPLKLTRDRAKEVKEYFTKEWDINPNRINIEARVLPKLATNIDYEEGASENRRVEIVSSSPEILKPISHSKFLENKANKDALIFPVRLNSNSNIMSANISLYLDGEKLYTSYVAGNPGNNPEFEFPQNTIDSLSAKAKLDSKLIARLTLEKKDLKAEIIEKEIPFSKESSDFEVGRLNLIVFDFDKANISKSNKEMIQRFLANSISDNSETTITGSTDRLGEAKYNKELSKKRAETVADFINQFKQGYKFKDVKGIGSSNLSFDNSTPEGRFYCRTVLVEVKTPLEK